jgi:hypothetical protein
MTATLDAVASKKKDKPEPTPEERAAEELVRRAREQGLSLTGPDGLLKQLTKVVLETALDQELTEHLGHEKNGPVVNGTGNVRTALDISWLIEQFGRAAPPAGASGDDRSVQQRLLAIAIDGLYATGAPPLPGHPPTTQHYEQRWQSPPAPE